MIFGATPALISPMFQPALATATAKVEAERKAATATLYNPNASAAQKQAAFETAQKLAPPPPPPPSRPNAATAFLTENKTTLLIGSGVALAAGVGYWAWKRRKR
jgi:LPXTG-motif cell wall-anchored protein